MLDVSRRDHKLIIGSIQYSLSTISDMIRLGTELDDMPYLFSNKEERNTVLAQTLDYLEEIEDYECCCILRDILKQSNGSKEA